MSITIQIQSFFLFFILGFILYMFYAISKKRNIKISIYYLFIIMLTFLFMILLYRINYGKIHIYFILMIIIGILVSKKSVKYLNKLINKLKFKTKK